MIDLLPPDDAYDAAQNILEDWEHLAADAIGDGTAVQWPNNTLSAATGRLAGLLLAQLAGHRPTWINNRWECPSCVEMAPIGFIRAAAPCAHLQAIYDVVLPGRAEEVVPTGLQMIIQDGTEPYVTIAAAELELMHNVPPGTARTHAASVLRVVTGRLRERL